MNNLKSSLICEGLTPPQLTFKLSYLQNPSYYTEMFTKVFIYLFLIN